jgi:hypothetical protein
LETIYEKYWVNYLYKNGVLCKGVIKCPMVMF